MTLYDGFLVRVSRVDDGDTAIAVGAKAAATRGGVE
jgi:hypothetical protein